MITASLPATVALPTWVFAQLLADWWSDPVDTGAAGDGAWSSVRTGGRSDPRGAIATAAAAQLGVAAHALARMSAAIGVLGIEEEHERLMVGPGRAPCPPYESMWHDEAPTQRGLMMGTAAGAVLALYRRAGLVMRSHAAELPDHLVVEYEALAWCLQDHREPAVARELLVNHLALWVPRFCKRVSAATIHPYYRALAALTPVWTRALADQQESRLAER